MGTPGAVSRPFVEDAILFAATIVPLLYFFGDVPILLVSTVHLASLPCAGIAHGSRIARVQTFLLSLVTFATTLVDLFVACFCACQYLPTDFCCEALSVVGAKCMDDFASAPLALFLFPVSVFNALNGVTRLFVIWRASIPEARGGVSFAFVVCVKSAYASLLWIESRETVAAHLLKIAVSYAGLAALVGASNWNGASEDALASCFFLDQIVLALQVRETLAGADSNLFPLGLAVVSLVGTSGLALAVDARYDAWIGAYAVGFGLAHAGLLWAWWSSLSPAMGAVAVAYLASPLLRVYLLRVDAFDAAIGVCASFLVVDGLVVGVGSLVVAEVDVWIACLMAFLELCGVSCLVVPAIATSFVEIGSEATRGFGIAFGVTVALQLVLNFFSQGVSGVAPWIVASALASSSVVGYVLLATLGEKENAKAELKLVVEGTSASTPSSQEISTPALSSLSEREDDDVVKEIVEVVKGEDTIARKVERLKRYLEQVDAEAKKRHLSAVVTSKEKLSEMTLTPKMFEEERALPPGWKSEMPANDVATAIRYVAKTCTPDKANRRLMFARARRSYVVQRDVDKIERLWKISRECCSRD